MRAGCIAQDMIGSPASPNPAGWYIHGAAQNRRGTVLPVSHILGRAEFFAPPVEGFIRRFGYSQTTLAQPRELGQVTTMRVLVVEDDEKIASFVIKGLKQNGYAVDHAVDGEHGLDLATAINYDLVILDLMLPKLDGLSVLRRLRQEKIRTPVLILSARANVDDRVRGLQAGGDDYLTKPFAFSELLARVQALIRRASHTVEQTQLSLADLSMNVITREVTRDGQRIELHPREYSLLEFLLPPAVRPVTKTMILE